MPEVVEAWAECDAFCSRFFSARALQNSATLDRWGASETLVVIWASYAEGSSTSLDSLSAVSKINKDFLVRRHSSFSKASLLPHSRFTRSGQLFRSFRTGRDETSADVCCSSIGQVAINRRRSIEAISMNHARRCFSLRSKLLTAAFGSSVSRCSRRILRQLSESQPGATRTDRRGVGFGNHNSPQP